LNHLLFEAMNIPKTWRESFATIPQPARANPTIA